MSQSADMSWFMACRSSTLASFKVITCGELKIMQYSMCFVFGKIAQEVLGMCPSFQSQW